MPRAIVAIMNKILQVMGPLVLPVVGVLLAVFSIIGAATIIDAERPIEWIPFALIGIAVALSQRFAPAAILVALLTVLLTVYVPEFAIFDRTLPVFAGEFIVIGVTAAARLLWVRLASLALGVVFGASLMYGLGVGRAFRDEIRPETIFAVASIWVPIAAVWLIGYTVRAGLARLESARARHTLEAEVAASEAELTIASERDRIAQDVHDIMAHSLSVIVAQADGARFVQRKQPGAVDASLAAIADSARESLAEVSLLIEGLSSTTEGHSHPSLAEIPALVARMESAGLAVVTTSHGEPSNLTLGQELALYRIVQESLTNALNNSGAHPSARVSWDWQGPGVALLIASTGDDVGHKQAAQGKRQEQQRRVPRGITGMRERARLAGGWLVAEPDADEPCRFVVTVFVPTASEPTASESHALATPAGAAQ